MTEQCLDVAWPDFQQADKDRIAKEKAAAQRAEETLAAYERVGLPRQAKLFRASRSPYPRAGLRDLVVDTFMRDRSPDRKDNCHATLLDAKEQALVFSVYGERIAIVDDVDKFNRSIPYAVVLAIEQAAEQKLFDRFVILAKPEDWGIQPRQADPVLLGVVDALGSNALDAAYFVISRWE